MCDGNASRGGIIPAPFFKERINMKVKVIKKSFYNSKLNRVGDIIDIYENELPSWAEAIEGDFSPLAQNNGEKGQKDNSQELEELSKLSDDEVKDKLDNLLNEAIDKGILIDFENKSDIQLIIELTDMLQEKK